MLEMVAPTHGKVLLNVIFYEFIDILAEFLLGRGSVVRTPASLLRSVLPTVASQHPGESEGARAPDPIPWLIQLEDYP